MLDFNNTQKAFAYKSKFDLIIANILFRTIQNNKFVSTLKFVTEAALKTHIPISWIIKPTLYRQFVGGESIQDCKRTIDLLYRYNVKSVLDYSSEGSGGEQAISATYNEIYKSIELASVDNRVSHAVFKPSALISKELLNRVVSSAGYLEQAEMDEYEKFKKRVLELCDHANTKGVKILIDAEDYKSQAVFDEIAEVAMRRCNTGQAIVFHTLQMYRKDRLEYLLKIHADAKRKNYIPGIKLVRGAYMEEERHQALIGGYDSPICDTKEQTDDNYDSALRYIIENLDNFELFCGTHNYASNILLTNLLEQNGISINDKRIYFSQLYGMSDNISFNLSDLGYNVCKYIPYAKVRTVLPYLLRRAQENTSISGQTGRELLLTKREIRRRSN